MGLFKRKPTTDPAEVAALRSEIADMRARLDAAEAAKAELADRLVRIDTATSASVTQNAWEATQVGQRIGELANRAEAAAARLAEIDELRARVEAAESSGSRIAELDGLQTRLEAAEALGTRVGELESLAAVPAQIAELSEKSDRAAADAAAAREQAAALDARLAQISTELANQLAELGREMDSLSSRPAPTPPVATSEVVVEQLREGQVRLANEQARYEIAFREDLATLAEQVRLLRGR